MSTPPFWFSADDEPETPETPKRRIFLSGGISGVPDFRYNFQQARYKLAAAGYAVEDPSLNEGMPGYTWKDWMCDSIRQLLLCDGVAMLPGYQYSKGARAEMGLAETLGMEVMMVDEWCMEVDKG